MKTNSKKSNQGQTALILILLSAAALIFFAITLNWGRIAQTKATLTIAADQGASLLASDAASYGEMNKQTWVQNTNVLFSVNWQIIIAIVVIVIAIAALILTGGASLLAILAVIAAIVNLVLIVTVVQPMVRTLWTKLQLNQPAKQQFYEQGLSTTLQGAVSDQVNITDYFDLNTNGVFGLNPDGSSKDSIGRFAFYYTERLKMLNKGDIHQVVFFYNQLGELMNGETCAQNEYDSSNYSAIPFNPACLKITGQASPTYCNSTPTDATCQMKIPNGFQLNDACTPNTNSGSATYTPYCDPCCQVPYVLDPAYSASSPNPLHPTPYRSTLPFYCVLPPSTSPPTNCTPPSSLSPGAATFIPGPGCAPTECSVNNPYSMYGSYPYLYDPNYQNYSSGISFLDQFGRDQQFIPPGSAMPLTSMTPLGAFPNGVFPFFWLMDPNTYSPQVDNINPISLQSAQIHWCVAGSTAVTTTSSNGTGTSTNITIPTSPTPSGFSDLAQLTLPSYTCQGSDCCVNYLADTVLTSPSSSISAPVPSTTASNRAIDVVGNPTLGANPANDPSFGDYGGTAWLPGDNQMCSSNPPYNGQALANADGICEWTNNSSQAAVSTTKDSFSAPNPSYGTVDGLDDTMHTLSDFVTYADTLLNQNVGALSSTLSNWYPQAATWIGPNGRLSAIYNPATGLDKFKTWDTVITHWLNINYASANAWCVPPQEDASMLAGGKPTTENTYINQNGAANDAGLLVNDPNLISQWGDLGYVISCLNYNAAPVTADFGAAYNYQQCVTALTNAQASNTCPTSLPAVCAAATLGRSLDAATPIPFGTDSHGCDITYVDSKGNPSFAKWANDSLTLFSDEAPKFALRAQYLNDAYTRAAAMSQIFTQADTAVSTFFKPCQTASTCADGGPAAQLAWAYNHGSQATSLPNAVIYGWIDDLPIGSTGGCTASDGKTKTGCAHLVKVLAYSPGRGGAAPGINPDLPWVSPTTAWQFSPIGAIFGAPGGWIPYYVYTLTERDGPVYVSVKRWDEDHGNPNGGGDVIFPNNHTLWQFMFHNPQKPIGSSGSGFPPACQGLPMTTNGGVSIGFGLMQQTVATLQSPAANISLTDQESLRNAFMLNDEGQGQGAGTVDGNAVAYNSNYLSCLAWANNMLSTAPESHACAEYIAWKNAAAYPSQANGPSGFSWFPTGNGNGGSAENDYSLRFVDCKDVSKDAPGWTNPPPDDLTYNGQAGQ